MRAATHPLFAGLVASLLLLGCERADPLGPGEIEPTLSSIQANIFDNRCAVSGCHLGGSAPLGLDLSANNARGNLVGVASQEVPSLLRVDPGNPDGSYLLQKIEGAPGIIGERMPRGRPPLRPEEIGAVRDWIAGGADD